MARREACGRAADIFSLGCVLLEIMTLQRCGSLKYIRLNRTDDPCFHANLDKIDDWLQSTTPTTLSARESFVNCEIKRMLAQKASERPVISELLPSFSAADMAPSKTQGLASMFGGCCGSTLKSREQHQEQITQLRSTLETMTTQSYESASRIDKLGEEKRQAQMRAAKFAEVHSNLQRDYSELYFTSQNLMEQNKELMNAKDGEVNRLADLQEQHSTLEQDYNKLYKKYRNFRLEYERLRDRIDGNVKRSTDSAEHLQDMSIDDTQERWSLEGASGQDDTDIFARPQKPQAKIQKLWRTILQK